LGGEVVLGFSLNCVVDTTHLSTGRGNKQLSIADASPLEGKDKKVDHCQWFDGVWGF